MKKALIALSVAAGMIAAAQAENTTTLYGTLKFQTQVQKLSSIKDNNWDLNNTSLKLGVKGTEDLANGLQVFYKMEFGGSDDKGLNETKKAYLGLTGGFGTLTLGKQDSLYKVVTNYNDIFESTYFGETMHYGAATGGGDLPKAISYVSPNMNGFQFGVAGVLDGSGDFSDVSNSKSFVAYQVGAWYSQNGFYAGIAYSTLDVDYATAASRMLRDELTGNMYPKYPNVDRANSVDVVGGAVGYKNDQFKVGFGAEHKSGNDIVGPDGNKYNLAGEYYYGPHTFRAGFGLQDDKRASSNVYTYALGYQYNFSKRTYTYVEGQYIDWNSGKSNGYTVNLGLRHNF